MGSKVGIRMGAKIRGTGSFLPERRVTNDELAASV